MFYIASKYFEIVDIHSVSFSGMFCGSAIFKTYTLKFLNLVSFKYSKASCYCI